MDDRYHINFLLADMPDRMAGNKANFSSVIARETGRIAQQTVTAAHFLHKALSGRVGRQTVERVSNYTALIPAALISTSGPRPADLLATVPSCIVLNEPVFSSEQLTSFLEICENG